MKPLGRRYNPPQGGEMRTFILILLFTCAGAAVAENGHYERVTVPGPSLAGNLAGDSPDREVSVYLPPAYAKQPARRFPVLYLLHGFTDNDAQWFGRAGKHFVHVPDAVDAAFKAGVPEFIVVMPNGFTKFQGSMYSSSAVNGDWETFVTRDLVKYVDGKYRTLPRAQARGLAGHSMGGYGALRIAMKVPGVFSAVYALSPCCLGPNLQPDARMYEGAARIKTLEEIPAADFFTKAMLASAAAWSPNPKKPPLYIDLPWQDGKLVPEVVAEQAANAPIALFHAYLPALRSYRALVVDSGDKDAFIAPTVTQMHALLDEYGIAHGYEIYDGDHLNRIHERLVSKVLPFFGEQFARQ
jgi:S-formylglutathione hydrolase FrmB